MKKGLTFLPLTLCAAGACLYFTFENSKNSGAESSRVDRSNNERTGVAKRFVQSVDFEGSDFQAEIGRVRAISIDDEGRFEMKISDGYSLLGKKISESIEGDYQSFAVELDDGEGSCVYYGSEKRERLLVFFNGSKFGHEFKMEGGEWKFEVKPLDALICASSHASWPLGAGEGMPKVMAVKADDTGKNSGGDVVMEAPANFQSKPGAPKVIYCDFDGEFVNQPSWNNRNSGNPINAAASGLNDGDIDRVMRRVAEDFAPFDVNVTNVRSVFDAAAFSDRVMCVCTPTDNVGSGFAGIAFLDTFVDDLVCWVFTESSPSIVADSISHEVGHTLNLEHDGPGTEGYYAGHDSDSGRWNPIMGLASGSSAISQWSKGEYRNANQTQDDLNLIVTNGLSYRSDDYGNTNASAFDVEVNLEPVSVSGVIERETDVDVFRVELISYSKISFAGEGSEGSNVDVKMRILNESGGLIVDINRDDSLNAVEERIWEPGIYFVEIQGDATGDPLANPPTGWTDYGSLGQYTLKFVQDRPTQNSAVDNFGTITNSGFSSWTPQTAVTHDGVDALESGKIDLSGNPLVQQNSVFSMQTSENTLSFWYKTSTNGGTPPNVGRRLEVTEDGFDLFTASGETDWTFVTLDLFGGTQTITWKYIAYTTEVKGDDKVWVDQIKFGNNLSGYGKWAADNGGSTSGEGDKDFDGVVDLLEYGLMGNPSVSEVTPLTVLNGGLRRLSFKRDATTQDLTYRVEVSEDLVNWATVALSYEGGDFTGSNAVSVSEMTSGGVDSISVTVTDTSLSARFYRVIVIQN